MTARKKTAKKKAVRKKASAKKRDPVTGDDDEHVVYVSYDMREHGGEICAGQEDDAYPNHEPIERDHTVIGVFREDAPRQRVAYNEHTPVDFEPFPGMQVQLVLVTYSSGDTFGSSSGNVSVVGVYSSEEEADKVALLIRKGGYPGYKAWEGYFDRLEDVEVHALRLDETEGVRRF